MSDDDYEYRPTPPSDVKWMVQLTQEKYDALVAERDAAIVQARDAKTEAAILRAALTEAVIHLGLVGTYCAVGECERCGGYIGTVSRRFCSACVREYLLSVIKP